MKTVRDIFPLCIQHVCTEKGRPRFEVELFMAHILHINRLELYMQFDRPLHEEELVLLRSGIRRMAQGEPVAYVIGEAFFCGEQFFVSKDVLIPRPETEMLVEAVLRWAKDFPSGVLIDVCTGSGCIGIVLKKKLPHWNVIVTDISQQALDVAKKNIASHGVDIEVLVGDCLDLCLGRGARCIVSNPPYVSSEAMKGLDNSVKAYEPLLALDGGEAGLDVYTRIIKNIPACIQTPAKVFFEIGFDQSETVTSLLQDIGGTHIQTEKDLFGNDRMVEALFV